MKYLLLLLLVIPSIAFSQSIYDVAVTIELNGISHELDLKEGEEKKGIFYYLKKRFNENTKSYETILTFSNPSVMIRSFSLKTNQSYNLGETLNIEYDSRTKRMPIVQTVNCASRAFNGPSKALPFLYTRTYSHGPQIQITSLDEKSIISIVNVDMFSEMDVIAIFH